jgi:tRNA (cmo5U34)-methyltransferase
MNKKDDSVGIGIGVGDGVVAGNANWSFGGNVHEFFDAHVSKSVPMYYIGHELIAEISDFFLSNDSLVYDLGCSTGSLLASLAERHKEKDVRFVGFDVEEGMVDKAKKKCSAFSNVEIECGSVLEMNFEKANLFTAYYTIQFIHPSMRQELYNKIYNSLEWGGGFIFFEKVRAPDARFQDMMSLIYNEYKLSQGYLPDEIISKSKSLKGVLEPFSTQGNIDLAKRAGFKDIMTVFKNVCFEGFLAIK